ncbi:hypothetical protein GHT06_003832 [Daphnia sinensis]|uniref:Uncharacterized protein n=1 Tax=Daphnia sinensis TaxID=1820382 RepID=A0AAD5PK05_9CRUS|nr:hypothetical protein GHT06_003832 [Daphnia sinensis]
MASSKNTSERIAQLEYEKDGLVRQNKTLLDEVDKLNKERTAYKISRQELEKEHLALQVLVNKLRMALKQAEERDEALPSVEYLRQVEGKVDELVVHVTELVGWMTLLDKSARMEEARKSADAEYVHSYVRKLMENPLMSMYHSKMVEKHANSRPDV